MNETVCCRPLNSLNWFDNISERGWVTIDTEIYFWNYETGGDLAYYEGLAEVVLSVGLVVPKPGVFQPHIKFLLVVCTASEVVVLGVTFESEGDDQYALMHLQPNPLFSLSSDGVNMVQVGDVSLVYLLSINFKG